MAASTFGIQLKQVDLEICFSAFKNVYFIVISLFYYIPFFHNFIFVILESFSETYKFQTLEKSGPSLDCYFPQFADQNLH